MTITLSESHIIPSSGRRFTSEAARWEAVRRRDPAADGQFFYAVTSTGVYCRPSCAARPARRENVRFHATTASAERAGFRPCKRCRPDLPPRADREAAVIAEACRQIDAADEMPQLSELAATAGLSAHHFHRTFKRIAGITPKAYAAARRQHRLQEGLATAPDVTTAIYDAGFNSSGRFYETADDMLGMMPSVFRQGGRGEIIHHAVAACSLGFVLVAATARGICAILLGDQRDPLIVELKSRFPNAEMEKPDGKFAALVNSVVRLIDDPASADGSGLPLDIRGTAFQRKVWQALRAIPCGETVTYGELARRLGMPRAVRAVARACATNGLAVVVPCHRVVASDGKLTGYRRGIERKRQLIARERRKGKSSL